MRQKFLNLLLVVLFAPRLAWADAPFTATNVVVTGAGGGVGLALTTHLLESGACVTAGVLRKEDKAQFAALRKTYPKALQLMVLDVTQEASVKAFAKHYGAKALDILVNVAGVNFDNQRRFNALPAAVVTATYEVNAVGPFRMTQALLPALHQSAKPIVVNISSVMGSIEENEMGGNIAYRMSKSALNMFTKCLAIEDKTIIALALHPGWVQTTMGGGQAQIDADTSAKGLLRVIAHAAPAQSGQYFRYTGEAIAW